jgi:tetratricopeptide (TPR) repeat protein
LLYCYIAVLNIPPGVAGMTEKIKAETQSNETYLFDSRRFTRARFAVAAGVFLAAFAIYAYTLAPTVTLVDSGELILAARTLGVAHPPGFPLYILLAHLATLLPFGNLAVRIHFASALFAALAAMFMTLLVAEALRIHAQLHTPEKRGKEHQKKKGRPSQTESESWFSHQTTSLLILAPALFSGVLFAFSRTLWAYATIVEVYTLNTLLIIIILYFMMRWRHGILDSQRRGNAPGDRPLFLAAFVFGLALGVHHVTVGLMLPALAALVFATAGKRFFTGKRIIYAALFAFAGLSIYVYLPIAASRSPLMNWGDPRTFERFFWHITGKQYQVFIDFSLVRITEFFKLAFRESGYSWLPSGFALAVAGFLYLFKRDKIMFTFLLLIVAADVIYCLGYEIDEDKDAYYLPAFIALTIAAGFAVHAFLNFIHATKLRAIFTPVRAALIVLLLPLITLAGNFAYNNRRNYFLAHDYVNNILNAVEPNGLLLTNDWQVYSPMLYVREIEHQRQDVIAIDVNQLRRSWYFDYLNQVYPELINRSRQQVDAYLEDLKNWEKNPEAYANNQRLTQSINTHFYDMIFSFVEEHSKTAPVYATQEIIVNRGGPDMELTTFLNEKFTPIPVGLLFRAASKLAPPQIQDPELITRGLADRSLTFADDDVVKKKVFPVYLMMLTNRGRFLAAQNQHQEAIRYFQQALALDATYAPAKTYLTQSLDALKK